MIPSPWEFLLLALAAFRITRLIAWDVFPPIVRLRDGFLFEGSRLKRPLAAALLECPFCLGAWVSLAVYLAWWAAPAPTLAVAAVAAISTIVGLIAKNLDE